MFFKPTYRVTAQYQLRTMGFIQPKPVTITIKRFKAQLDDIEDLLKSYIESDEDSPIKHLTITSIKRV